MERFWREWGAPAEPGNAGSSEALESEIGYIQRIGAARVRGDRTEVRRLVTEGTQRFPKEPTLRLIAATHLQFLGEHAEAMAQLAVVIATTPELYTAYVRLARLLAERGEREAALDVLKTGWSYRQRLVPRRRRAAERAKFFAILDAPVTAASGESPHPSPE